MEFDHRDRATKLKEVSTLVRHAHSWGLVLREIDKCDVRCANCHRKKTAAEDNSWRHRLFLDMAPPPPIEIDGGGQEGAG